MQTKQTLKEKLPTFEEFKIYAKTAIKNVSLTPTLFYFDKIEEIYKRKLNDEFTNPFSNEFTRASNKHEYWIERGFTKEEAETKKKEKVLASSSSLEALIIKHGQEEGTRKFHEIVEKKSNTLTGFIKRHGKTKGKELYDSYCSQMASQNTLEGMVKRYGLEEGTIRYESMLKGKSQSLASCIIRHGENEGKKRHTNMNKKRSKANSLEGYICKFGDEEGNKKYNEFITFRKYNTSLSYYTDKFGEELGNIKYREWYTTTIGGNNSLSQSKISKTLFEKLEKASEAKFGEDEETIELNESEQELLSRTFIRPDFIVGNKIIEFYGDYWHCHPMMFEAEQINPQVNKTAQEIREYDALRISILENKGYEVLTVWESDFVNSPEEIINQCNDFIGRKY